MVANMEENNSDYSLDSVDEGCYDSGMNDVSASSIEIGDEE